MSGASAIALRDVGKVFVRDDGAAVNVLEHVTFDVAAGSFVCLVGRSGSGKSTILNMIAGLIGTSSGTIAFADGVTKRPRLDVGYMTQKETLLPWRDVLQNVAMPLEVRGVPTAEREKRALELIALVGLAGAEKRYPRELSGRDGAARITRAHARERSRDLAARRTLRRARRATARRSAARTAALVGRQRKDDRFRHARYR
jgi:ABC-type nitrate/sulfonate/bicarbonate transport system ATPase subunit